MYLQHAALHCPLRDDQSMESLFGGCVQLTMTHITVATQCKSAHGRLKFTGQKTGVGVYTEKPFVHITHIHTDPEEVGTGHVKLSINWPGMHSRHVTTK